MRVRVSVSVRFREIKGWLVQHVLLDLDPCPHDKLDPNLISLASNHSYNSSLNPNRAHNRHITVT